MSTTACEPAALLIHCPHQNSQNKAACNTSRVCLMFVRAFVFILFFHERLKCVSPPPSLPASRLWCPTQGKTKSSSFHLIAQLQHDSWNSLQSHAALSVSMSCFCCLPPSSPPLPPTTTTAAASFPLKSSLRQRRGPMARLAGIKKRGGCREMSCVCVRRARKGGAVAPATLDRCPDTFSNIRTFP